MVYRWGSNLALGLTLALGLSLVYAAEYVPRDALIYQRDLTRNVRSVWGLDAPLAVFAAQIHQESLWRPNARSPYAGGMAQFTPDTANWISGVYPQELGDNQPFNPSWAMRALARYDKHLWDSMPGRTGCDRWAFTLSAYNGGAGWVARDRKLAVSRGHDGSVWFGQVELFNAGRAPHFFEENRGYPRRILLTLQPIYAGWGSVVHC